MCVVKVDMQWIKALKLWNEVKQWKKKKIETIITWGEKKKNLEKTNIFESFSGSSLLLLESDKP